MDFDVSTLRNGTKSHYESNSIHKLGIASAAKITLSKSSAINDKLPVQFAWPIEDLTESVRGEQRQ